MSRRTAAPAHRRARAPTRPVHVPEPDPDVPGVCTCRLPLDAPNAAHISEYPATDPAVRTEEARRIGERD